jgi:hypothetical protein
MNICTVAVFGGWTKSAIQTAVSPSPNRPEGVVISPSGPSAVPNRIVPGTAGGGVAVGRSDGRAVAGAGVGWTGRVVDGGEAEASCVGAPGLRGATAEGAATVVGDGTSDARFDGEGTAPLAPDGRGDVVAVGAADGVSTAPMGATW